MNIFTYIYGKLNKIGLDWFILGLGGAILLAYIAPQIGCTRESFSPSELANWLLTLIFFFYGLRLDFAQIKKGLSNYKLHIVVQLSTFALFPLLLLAYTAVFGAFKDQYLYLGVFFMCALPSTVSSSVVMVSIASGNIPAAIFNASLSGILGIFITPLLMSFAMQGAMPDADLGPIFAKLFAQVLLPVVLGVLLNKRFGEWAKTKKRLFRNYDQSVILLIVYTSFCDSFYKHMFDALSLKDIVLLTIGLAAMFFAAYAVILLVSKLLKFDRNDTITALFCGSKKSLAHGAVMSKVIVPDPSKIAIIILPIMIYHAFQLVVASIIAKKLAKTAPQED